MGQRANLVIVKNGDWRLYYDHWCANRLDVELFWGPQLATEFIEGRPPLQDRTHWLDEIWCEGAAIVDHDQQVLLWYGGEDILFDVPLRRAFLAMMQRQWRGWEIRWATGGVVELAHYLQVPTQPLLTGDDLEQIPFHAALTGGSKRVLFSKREQHSTSAAPIAGEPESIERGCGQLPFLLALATEPSLVWKGDPPICGLHLALDDREIVYWSAFPLEASEQRVQRAWPGWKVTWLRDHYEEHLRLGKVNVLIAHRGPAELEVPLIEYLKRNCHKAAENPAEKFAKTIGATSVNPATNAARGSVGNAQGKLDILEQLERRTFWN